MYWVCEQMFDGSVHPKKSTKVLESLPVLWHQLLRGTRRLENMRLLQEEQLLLDSVDRHAYRAAQNTTEATGLLRRQFSSLQAQRRQHQAGAASTQRDSVLEQTHGNTMQPSMTVLPSETADPHLASGPQVSGKSFAASPILC
jgi:hypothetical protein